MEIKSITIPILGILIIGGIAADVEYKSHTGDYDITTIYKLQSAYNTGKEGNRKAFKNDTCPECYDVKIHLKTNAIGMPIELNGQILSSDKRSLEFIVGNENQTDILTRNEIEYNANNWRISDLYTLSNDNDIQKYNRLLVWKAKNNSETFKIKWKQRNTIQTCISVSYLLEDESKCTFEMTLQDTYHDYSHIFISEPKQLKTVLFKSKTLLHQALTYSLHFKLQKKTRQEKKSNPNYEYYKSDFYNQFMGNEEYIYNTVPIDGCLIGIKRIAQCTDEYENEEILTLTTKQLQKTPSAASLTFNVYPSAYNDLPMGKSKSPSSTCLNGGYENENGCMCPPGFKGNRCEQGCGPNAFGIDCTGICSMYQTQCRQMMICTNGFGCNCPTGYTGNDCATECTSGTYGVNCEQQCLESCGSKSCDIYTGVCNKGCKTMSYISPTCTEKYPWIISPPQMISSDFMSLVLKIDFSSKNINGSTNIKSTYYQIIFQAVANESLEFQYLEPKEIGEQKSVLETIDNLKQGIWYSFGVILISEDGNYNSEDIITANYSTKCLLPSNINYDVILSSGTDYINVTWNKVNDRNEDCKVTDYLLKLMFNYTENQQQSYFFEEVKSNNNNGYIFEKLLSGEKYAIQVTALTAMGEAKASEISYIYTKFYGPFKIKNIKAKLNQSSPLILTWDIDEKYTDTPLNYMIKYKVIKHLSCLHQVVTNNWTSLLVYNEMKRDIWDLIPNTQYIIKVDPSIIGYTYNDYANIIFVKTPISNPKLTPKVNDENGSYITNQSAYFNWTVKKTECLKLNGFFRGYYVILKNIVEGTQIAEYTKQNTVYYDGLRPDTKYELQVYVWTNYGYNSELGLLIPFKTKTKFLIPVDKLVVYKKNLKHKSIGIRWSFPDEYIIDGFIIIVIDENINCSNQITTEPNRCIAWPQFYCTTLENIIPNHQYTIKIKAKSPDYPTGGLVAAVVFNFINGLADKPENLRAADVGLSSITLKWDIPLIFNGELKSFIVNTVEISSKDTDNCCDSKPDIEIPVTEEVASYGCMINDLKPGSTYSIGVFSKTLSYGQTNRINVTIPVVKTDVDTDQPIEPTEPTSVVETDVDTDQPIEPTEPTSVVETDVDTDQPIEPTEPTSVVETDVDTDQPIEPTEPTSVVEADVDTDQPIEPTEPTSVVETDVDTDQPIEPTEPTSVVEADVDTDQPIEPTEPTSVIEADVDTDQPIEPAEPMPVVEADVDIDQPIEPTEPTSVVEADGDTDQPIEPTEPTFLDDIDLNINLIVD